MQYYLNLVMMYALSRGVEVYSQGVRLTLRDDEHCEGVHLFIFSEGGVLRVALTADESDDLSWARGVLGKALWSEGFVLVGSDVMPDGHSMELRVRG